MNQKDEGTQADRRRDRETNFILRIEGKVNTPYPS